MPGHLDSSAPRFYYGTKADLKPEDVIEPGHPGGPGQDITPGWDGLERLRQQRSEVDG